MSKFMVEITLREGTLRLEVEWSGTWVGLERVYRQMYPDYLHIDAWERNL